MIRRCQPLKEKHAVPAGLMKLSYRGVAGNLIIEGRAPATTIHKGNAVWSPYGLATPGMPAAGSPEWEMGA